MNINIKRILNNINGTINNVHFDKTGEYCITSSNTITLWNPHKHKNTIINNNNNNEIGICEPIKIYESRQGRILDCILTSSNDTMISCGTHNEIYEWDVKTGQIKNKYNNHTGRINKLYLNYNDNILFSGSYDTTLCIWDRRSRSKIPLQVIDEPFNDSITSIVLTENENEFIIGCVDGNLSTFDIRKGKIYKDYLHYPITSLSLSKYDEGKCILVSCLQSNNNNNNNNNDNYIKNGIIYLIDKNNGELLTYYKGHKHEEFNLTSCFSNTESEILSGSEDGNIYIWNQIPDDNYHENINEFYEYTEFLYRLGNYTPINELKYHTSSISSITFHPNEYMFIAGSYDGTASIWM